MTEHGSVLLDDGVARYRSSDVSPPNDGVESLAESGPSPALVLAPRTPTASSQVCGPVELPACRSAVKNQFFFCMPSLNHERTRLPPPRCAYLFFFL